MAAAAASASGGARVTLRAATAALLPPPPLAAGRTALVYSDAYNIRAFGLERLHPFDAAKYGRVFARLEAAGAVTRATCAPP